MFFFAPGKGNNGVSYNAFVPFAFREKKTLYCNMLTPVYIPVLLHAFARFWASETLNTSVVYGFFCFKHLKKTMKPTPI